VRDGDVRSPLQDCVQSKAEVEEKAMELMASVIGVERARSAIEEVDRLEQLPKLDSLISTLRP